MHYVISNYAKQCAPESLNDLDGEIWKIRRFTIQKNDHMYASMA